MAKRRHTEALNKAMANALLGDATKYKGKSVKDMVPRDILGILKKGKKGMPKPTPSGKRMKYID